MDFNFTEEQTMLRDTVARFVSQAYDFDKRRAIITSATGWSADNWRVFAEELGILGAPFSEDLGGLGGGAIENMIVMEEFGKGLVVEPYLGTVVIGGGFLKAAGGDVAADVIGQIIEGKATLAFAWAERQGRFNLADILTTAKKDGDGWVINGAKSVVIGAPWASHLIVTARTSGGQRDAGGVSVFLVDKADAGVATRDYPTVDGLRASEITFENARATLLGEADAGLPLVEQVVDEAIAALCAEACGAMKIAHADTVDYARTRKQFGVPIASFQVLQHRMVDMFMAYEQSVSMTYMVTLKLGESALERAKAASAAKVQIGKAGRLIGQDAVQIHGGMGMTEELRVGHYFKRLTMIETTFGGVDHHLKRYAALTSGDRIAAE
jgi:alkylation response protein AidB-like acyl-CoA dehydrogenase